MEPLPMAPAACSLDEAALSEQLSRYRAVGERARLLADEPRVLTLRVEAGLTDLVDELIAVERACCPFFDLSWDPATRRFAISVRTAGQESALAVIRAALRG
jgi:hypothetical protein